MTDKKPYFVSEEEINFLIESNAIEGVFDPASLDDAVAAWRFMMEQDVLGVHEILETHKILMQHQPLKPDEIGKFRRCAVFVGGFEALPWQQVPGAVQMKFCFEGIRAKPPIDPKALHIVYEKIHPFVDGNGRTGRIFMNWQRIKRLGLPLLTIKNAEKQDYYDWFK